MCAASQIDGPFESTRPRRERAKSAIPSMTTTLSLASRQRLASIDILRGTVMLLDHVRETFFLHHQVADPMDVPGVEPALFFARMLAHLCAPVFVFLTGLSAWLYGHRQSGAPHAASAFLFKRGVFLVLLELTLVNFAWTAQFPPTVVYLQVIWAIGLSMIALSALLWLPRWALVALGGALVAGHNLLDGIQAVSGTATGTAWLVLHERGWFEMAGIRFRTSYPVLPWIGVIALGYAAGQWYAEGNDAKRRKYLLRSGAVLLAAFAALRFLNLYGDAPWHASDGVLTSLMSFLNVTKYPPSLLFLLLTLGVGAWLLCAFENTRTAKVLYPLSTFGAAPMFFYLLHLYVLRLLYVCAHAIWGDNQGSMLGVDGMAGVWAIALALALWWPTHAFAGLKARRRNWPWLRYL